MVAILGGGGEAFGSLYTNGTTSKMLGSTIKMLQGNFSLGLPPISSREWKSNMYQNSLPLSYKRITEVWDYLNNTVAGLVYGFLECK
jgi:hypothetical protein